MRNHLWYIVQNPRTTIYCSCVATLGDALVNKVTGSTLHHLWHHRLGHAGRFACDNVASVTKGVSNLKKQNQMFHCNFCSSAKMTKNIKGHNVTPMQAIQPEGRFEMDFGFVQGATVYKKKDGPLLTSKDGYSCYLLGADEYSRHLWIFLYASKAPPITNVCSFLSTHGLLPGIRRV